MKLLQLEYRDEAIKQLKKYFFELLNKDFHRHIIAFQAPTGSGKTVTMACLLKEIVNSYLHVKVLIKEKELELQL